MGYSYYVCCKQVVSIPGYWRYGEIRSISVKDYSKAVELQRAALSVCNKLLDEGQLISYSLSIEVDGGAGNE